MCIPKEMEKQFQVLLEKQDLKYTYERQTILDEVCHWDAHFDADSLYERFKNNLHSNCLFPHIIFIWMRDRIDAV